MYKTHPCFAISYSTCGDASWLSVRQGRRLTYLCCLIVVSLHTNHTNRSTERKPVAHCRWCRVLEASIPGRHDLSFKRFGTCAQETPGQYLAPRKSGLRLDSTFASAMNYTIGRPRKWKQQSGSLALLVISCAFRSEHECRENITML